jgi:hypothetical protein
MAFFVGFALLASQAPLDGVQLGIAFAIEIVCIGITSKIYANIMRPNRQIV